MQSGEIGWRARGWALSLVVLCVTALLQVEASTSAVIGSCNPDNTCPDKTLCCSINGFCGNNASYCGAGQCFGGPCSSNSHGKHTLSVGVIIGIAIGVAVGIALVLLVAILFVTCRRAQRTRKEDTFYSRDIDLEAKGLGNAYNQIGTASAPGLSKSGPSVKSSDLGRRISYETLQCATKGFKDVLGRGSFGIVYKGTLLDGTEIAVKQLINGERDMKDFETEVKTLGTINHANLVALLGFAFENNQFFLVYEFVSNGSLDRWIFKEEKADVNFVLPWKTRVNILKGTAKGLAYLHEELQRGQTIIHLDIKPQNILLDEFYLPKIADFGLAKLLGSATTKETLAAGGTKGYMAPEIYVAAVTQKMDVYSFGMVMLEVVSGRESVDYSVPLDRFFLPAWTIRKALQGEEVDIVDHLLEDGHFDASIAERLIWIALLCLQGDPDERPGMSTVLRMMEGIIDPPDLPPALQAELEKVEKLVRGRQVGGSSRECDDSSDNMIKFSGDSRKYKGRRQRSRNSSSNDKPERRTPSTSSF